MLQHVSVQINKFKKGFNKPLFKDSISNDFSLSDDHPLAIHFHLPITVLSNIPFIERENCSLFNKTLEDLKKKGIEVNGVFSAQSNDLVISLIFANRGFSFISKPVLFRQIGIET